MNCLFFSYNSVIMEYSGIIILILFGIEVSTRIKAEADITDYPFMVSLVLKDAGLHDESLLCSGSIIGKYWAITAPVFFYAYKGAIDKQRMFVRGNTTFLYKGYRKCSNTPYAIDHLVIHYIIHELYSEKTYDYNVALLKVKEPFDGVFERPISYATVDYNYLTGSQATVLAWGSAVSSEDPSTKPGVKHKFVKLENAAFCSRISASTEKAITPRMICGGAATEFSCTDEGAPLVQFIPYPLLIGVRSWRDGVHYCLWHGDPDVYTNIGVFHGWILDHLQRDLHKS